MEFPEPKRGTPGGLKLLVLGAALYAVGLCVVTVVILYCMRAGA